MRPEIFHFESFLLPATKKRSGGAGCKKFAKQTQRRLLRSNLRFKQQNFAVGQKVHTLFLCQVAIHLFKV